MTLLAWNSGAFDKFLFDKYLFVVIPRIIIIACCYVDLEV